MNHDSMIAIIAAHRDGKEIEWRLKESSTWQDYQSQHWNFEVAEYRIKPELPKLREVWIIVIEGLTFPAFNDAERFLQGLKHRSRITRIAEVLPSSGESAT